MPTSASQNPAIDVLIVTAVREEIDAVRSIDAGAVPGSSWESRSSPTGLDLFLRVFQVSGGTLGIAVTRAFDMGREQAVMAAAPLLGQHPEIRCLAMCGVCAGRRGDVNLGDVIIADRSWPYDAGKLKVTYEDGKRVERLEGDMQLYRIEPPGWKHLAERFSPDLGASWIAQRPRSYEAQGHWLLEQLEKGNQPTQHADRTTECPDWGAVLKQLWKVKWLEDGTLTLTQTGRHHIRRLMLLHPDGLPDADAFKVVVGPIASGAPVVEDPAIFDRLAREGQMRKVVGLEMETSAILAFAYIARRGFAVVMKGVMDHADVFKSDNMKAFAARASAECLIAFLRQNMPPGTATLPASAAVSDTSPTTGKSRESPAILASALGADTPSPPFDQTGPLRFRLLIQAKIEIESYHTSDEINRVIEGAELTTSGAFADQYEFMQLCRTLRGCRYLIEEIRDNRPATFDAGLFPQTVTLDARLRVKNSSNEIASFHIREQPSRELAPEPGEARGIVIRYKVLGEHRVDVESRGSRYIDLKISLYYLGSDYPEFSRREGRGDLDLEAVFYLLGAQAIRDRLMLAMRPESAIPIDIEILFDDGFEKPIRFNTQITAIPKSLENWKCHISRLEKALRELHQIADPFYSLRLRMSLLREIRRAPDQKRPIKDRDSYAQALQQIREIVSKVRPTPTHAERPLGDQDRQIVEAVKAHHRGDYD